jgi:DNA-binding transcriptional ArsR family regulator
MAGERAARRRPRLARVAGAAVAADLDRVIHERVRLGIVSALAGSPSMTFVELKDALGLSDGNLSVHARRLEEGRSTSRARRASRDGCRGRPTGSPRRAARPSPATSTTWRP